MENKQQKKAEPLPSHPSPKRDQTAPVATSAAQGGNVPSGIVTPVVAESIGVASSLLAGGITAKRLIEERAYKNTSSLYFIEDIKKERAQVGPGIAQEVESGLLTKEQGYQKLRDAVFQYEHRTEQRLAKAGVSGVFNQFGLLRSHQRWEVAMTALATIGVTLGAALLLTRSMFSQQEQNQISAPSGESGRTPE